jgi:rubredoxin
MELPWLVFTAMLTFLAGVVLVWIGYEILRRWRQREVLRHWIQCHVCSFRYKADPSDPLPRCRQCGSANEHIPVRFF